MRILVLTDHSGHTVNNSLYALVRAMLGVEGVGEIRVASRGTPANAEFFAASAKTSTLQCVRAAEDFAFRENSRSMFGTWDDGVPTAGNVAPGKAARSVFGTRNATVLTQLDWPDAVLLRIPHPVLVNWFSFLREAFGDTVIVNRPEGIAATTSKAWLLNVPELCAPMALCRAAEEVQAFANTHDTVLKPLEGYGGKGVIRILRGTVEIGNRTFPIASWPKQPEASLPYLAMQYLPRVSEGDKRIVVASGRVLGAVNRVPAAGKWLANVAQGGHAEPATLTPAEERIVEVLHPKMSALGVTMYGVDTLVGNEGHRVLSEVNTMSIGGLLDLPPTDGKPAAQHAAEALVAAMGRGADVDVV